MKGLPCLVLIENSEIRNSVNKLPIKVFKLDDTTVIFIIYIVPCLQADLQYDP